MSGGGSSVDLDVITAEAGDILAGKTGIDPEGESLPGTMPNRGAVSQTLNAGGSYSIPQGYHNGSGKVTANSLASQTGGTAVAAHLLNGETAWVNGNRITGAMTVNSLLSFSVAVISGRRVTATWQNPIQAAGKPYSGVYIKYSTNGYPGTGGTQIYKGPGSNTSSGGTSTATFDLPNLGTRYYLSIYPYVTTSAGELLGSVLNAQVTTGGEISYTYTSSTIVTVPQGYTQADIFCVGGGGAGSLGRTDSYDHYGGGGGGGGRTSTAWNVSVSGGQSLAVIIGAGGASSGDDGGASSVSRSGSVLCSANGGDGGSMTTSVGRRGGGDGGSGGGAGGGSGSTTRVLGGVGGSDGGNGGDNNGGNYGGDGQGSTTRAWGSGTLYSGGGAGGNTPTSAGSVRQSGGAGGGGSGGARGDAWGAAGSANTGGGGGGGAGEGFSGASAGSGGAGGSGIVLIRFH